MIIIFVRSLWDRVCVWVMLHVCSLWYPLCVLRVWRRGALGLCVCGSVVLWGCVLPECGLSSGVCGHCGVIGSRDA